MIQIMMWGRKSLWESIVIWWCLYILWLCTDHVVVFVLKNNEHCQVTMTTNNSHNNKQNKQLPQQTFNIQHSTFVHTQKHRTVAQMTSWCRLGPRYVHIGPSLPSSHLSTNPGAMSLPGMWQPNDE